MEAKIEKSRKIIDLFLDSIAVKKNCINSGLDCIATIGDEVVKSIKNGGKLMLCGNGGSAADAQHLAAEMLIRLRPKNNREGVPAIALAQDTSTITACANDFGYEKLYSRLVSTLGKPGDCLLGISTSGNSENVNLALSKAKKMGLKTFGFLGADGGNSLKYCDEVFLVPNDATGRVQEAHITAGHALMEYIEDALLESGYLSLNENQ